MSRYSRLLPPLLLGGLLLVPPAVSVVLLGRGHTNASLTPLREILPNRAVTSDISGVTGLIRLSARLSPEAGHALPARGSLTITMESEIGTDSLSVFLEREARRTITLPRRKAPRSLSLRYVPSVGSEPGAALIAADVTIQWDDTLQTNRAIGEAIRAWLMPFHLGEPVGLLFVSSLVVGFISIAVGHRSAWARGVSGFGRGWSWFFLSAALLCAFPADFSPLTRLPVFGSVPLCLFVLAALSILLFRHAQREPWANRHTYVLVLLTCGAIRLFSVLEIAGRQPKDIDEIVYTGVARNIKRGHGIVVPNSAYKTRVRNIKRGHGIVVPNSAYKTRDLEHIDPIRKLWWTNDLYLGIARKGEPTAAVPPLYPLFLSCFVTKLGIVSHTAYIVQAVLSTVTVALLYLVGTRIVGRTAALGGILLATLHASDSAVSRYFFTETLFLFVLVLAAYFVLKPRAALAAGVLLGLAGLTRSVALALLPVWLLVSAIMPGKPRLAWKGPVVLLAGFLLAVGPWALRNLRTVGDAAVGSTFAGKDLFVGNNDTYRRSARKTPWRRWEKLSTCQRTILTASGAGKEQVHQMFSFPVEIPNESARSKELRRRAVCFMVAYPRTFLKLTLRRMQQLLEVSREPSLWNRTGHLPGLMWPIIFLVPIGLVWGSGQVHLRLFMVASAVLLILPPLFSVGFPRYRLPFDMLLCPVAGAGLECLLGLYPLRGPKGERWRGRKRVES